MKEIELTQGKVALVDDEDYEWLNQWKWCIGGFQGRYAYRCKEGKSEAMHRLILDAPKSLHVDHINHNGLDNRRTNIRLCTRSQNIANSRPRANKTSQYRGVSWEKGKRKWRAQISTSGRSRRLGRFHDEIKAACAYDEAASEQYGEFASLNNV